MISIIGIGAGAFALPPLVGMIMGFVARGRVRRSEGRLSGDRQAIAAIVIGLVASAVWIFVYAVVFALSGHR